MVKQANVASTVKFSWLQDTTETAWLGTECSVKMNEISFFASKFK